MKTSDLLFIGIKGSVVALNRATALQVWATHLKGSDFVNVIVQDGTILASCCGERIEVAFVCNGGEEGVWH